MKLNFIANSAAEVICPKCSKILAVIKVKDIDEVKGDYSGTKSYCQGCKREVELRLKEIRENNARH